MTIESATLLLLAIVLVAFGHVCGRVTRSAEETWWLAFGCLVGFADVRFDIGPGLDASILAGWIHDLWLPLFVFAAAYAIDRRCVGHHRIPVVVLPLVSLAVAVSATIWAFSAGPLPPLPWAGAAVFGAVLAATDASAVTAQLPHRAPRGIRILLNGEMVFATAAAYTIADIALGMTTSVPDGTRLALQSTLALAGGAAIGAAFAWLGGEGARRLPSDALAHWLVPLAGLGSYLSANALGLSGIAACLLAGVVLARRPEGAASVPVWGPLGLGIRGLVFLGAGYLAPGLPFAAAAPYLPAALVLMLASRFAAVYVVTSVIHRLSRFAITLREQALISTFSTRGVATLALALALPSTLPWAALIQSIALVVVALDLLVITPATPWLAKRFANHAPLPPVYAGRRRIAN